MIKKGFLYIFIITLLSCDPQLPPYDMPFVPFNDITVNLTLPEFQPLQIDRGHVYINDAGVRGLIVYRESLNQFHVFERNCTWDANSACATVEVDASTLFMFDPCCGSTFSFPDGAVSGGVAVYPLRKYRYTLSGSLLTITDEILNN